MTINKSRSDLGVSEEEAVLAVLRNPQTYELAEAIPDADPLNGGRKRKYPKYLFVVMASLNDIYRSGRHATTAIHGPFLWSNMRSVVAEMFPNDATMHLPAEPPSRTWFIKFRDRYVLNELAAIQAKLMETGVATAVAIGLDIVDESQPFKVDDMDRRIAVDGKVLKPMTGYVKGDTVSIDVKDAETGEITVVKRKRRHDPDAKAHRVGDGRQVHGNKFFQASVRGEEEHRAKSLGNDKRLIYRGRGSEESQQASCCEAVANTIVRAGLGGEPDVRPASVPAWTGRRIFEETRSIEEVARRLGIRSLDAAAQFIALNWHE